MKSTKFTLTYSFITNAISPHIIKSNTKRISSSKFSVVCVWQREIKENEASLNLSHNIRSTQVVCRGKGGEKWQPNKKKFAECGGPTSSSSKKKKLADWRYLVRWIHCKILQMTWVDWSNWSVKNEGQYKISLLVVPLPLQYLMNYIHKTLSIAY